MFIKMTWKKHGGLGSVELVNTDHVTRIHQTKAGDTIVELTSGGSLCVVMPPYHELYNLLTGLERT